MLGFIGGQANATNNTLCSVLSAEVDKSVCETKGIIKSIVFKGENKPCVRAPVRPVRSWVTATDNERR